MSRTGVRRRRVALAAAAGLLAAAWAGPVGRAIDGRAEVTPVARSSYVVHGGDTLWSIARRLEPDADPRPLVDAIARANRVDAGALVPGQSLVIPATG